ncbi:ubiquitin-specific protease ubp15 [Coemansia sp. RSA 1358]|uniref:ubiquitinyl hydrolase 1 n=1 Tax=Coemansia umbellata TaxID=1424467 RepID=A0ABQ8PG57_9FUNG|nr:ubiquitin-specific protease ubp15 [Coemansia umbellata]KAJ2619754.1 ubiquitin-specific protease ubp15 [Coemansia sp. RSA 1358]
MYNTLFSVTKYVEEEYIAANIVVPPKLEEEGHGYFHWEIDDWTQLPERATSKTFTIAGHDWSLLVFPRGNRENDAVSLYIEYKPKEGQKDDWHACALFVLTMSNIDQPELFKKSSAHHRFTPEETDWGFTRFVEIRDLITPIDEDTPPLLEKSRVRISAFVRVIKDPLGVLWHNFFNYNSRKNTGYVGLKNQGATCYMNSLLQSLYFTNQFRNAVYQIPTENDDTKKSVALALQRVFYNLQVSDEAVDTTELTKSFGWDSIESFWQHDVQELNRILQDNLETKMKGTVVDGAIAKLFEGKMKSYIRCVNVDYESSRIENYYDISVNVKNCATLRDSFANYCEVEMLDGENKYQAEGYGLQDARKGVIFESFPPVLHLHLKRFEYDFTRDAMVKINDRHEFPPTIDLEEFLSEDADRSMSWRYRLHGVLVHSGDLHGGHYFGLLRPTVEDKWYRFDDDRVVPVSSDEVFEEYYGGEISQVQAVGMRVRPNSKRFTNAYMLVYIREALSDQVMCDGDAPVPEHLLRRIQEAKDEEARRLREKQEMASMITVKVVSNEQFAKHQGFDLCYFGSRQPKDNMLYSELLPRNMTLGEFKSHYAERAGLNPNDIRLWTLVGRMNKTVRCDAPLMADSTDLTLVQIKETRALKKPDLCLYCEMRGNVSPEQFLTEKPKPGVSLIHIKYYDPEQQLMAGIGTLYIYADKQVRDIIPDLWKMANLKPNTPITLYEEVKPSLIEEMDINLTFQKAEIQNGDIICFQVTSEPGSALSLDTVPKYFDFIQHRVSVSFVQRPMHNNGDDFIGQGNNGAADSDSEASTDAITVMLSTKTPYDQIAQLLSEEIGERDPLRIRFYTVGPNGQPRQPVRRMASTTLSDMLPSMFYGQPSLNSEGLPEYVVMYERLEVNIVQIENMRNIRVLYIGKNMKDEHAIELLVPKTGPSQQLIEATYGKVEQALRKQLRDETQIIKPFALRFYAVGNHRVKTVMDGSENMEELGGQRFVDVVAEHVRPEDSHTSDGEQMDADDNTQQGVDIEVFHFHRDLSHTHSVPFLFRIYPGEKWVDTWERLGQKLGLGEKELKSIGVVVGPYGAVDLQACQLVQGSISAENSPGTGQHTPAATPSVENEDANMLDGSGSRRLGSVEPSESKDVCVWEVIRTMVAGQSVEGSERPVAPGFIALNHIDRSSRHRGMQQERGIRILN